MSDERLVCGVHIIPLRDFIMDTFDADTQRQIREQLSPETQQMLASVQRTDWHPMWMVGEMNRGIYGASGSADQGYADVVRAGTAVADYATNTFLRLLIKLMTPEIMARKWPSVWKKSHNFGRMDTSLDKGDRPRLTMRLSDVDDYDYIGPTAVGFLTYSLKAMGFPEARVTQHGDHATQTASEYEFEVTW